MSYTYPTTNVRASEALKSIFALRASPASPGEPVCEYDGRSSLLRPLLPLSADSRSNERLCGNCCGLARRLPKLKANRDELTSNSACNLLTNVKLCNIIHIVHGPCIENTSLCPGWQSEGPITSTLHICHSEGSMVRILLRAVGRLGRACFAFVKRAIFVPIAVNRNELTKGCREWVLLLKERG